MEQSDFDIKCYLSLSLHQFAKENQLLTCSVNLKAAINKFLEKTNTEIILVKSISIETQTVDKTRCMYLWKVESKTNNLPNSTVYLDPIMARSVAIHGVCSGFSSSSKIYWTDSKSQFQVNCTLLRELCRKKFHLTASDFMTTKKTSVCKDGNEEVVIFLPREISIVDGSKWSALEVGLREALTDVGLQEVIFKNFPSSYFRSKDSKSKTISARYEFLTGKTADGHDCIVLPKIVMNFIVEKYSEYCNKLYMVSRLAGEDMGELFHLKFYRIHDDLQFNRDFELRITCQTIE